MGAHAPTADPRPRGRPQHRRRPAAIRLTLLDRFELREGAIAYRPSRAGQRLLVLLALHPGPVRRALAAQRLWPHLDERGATGSLRSTLSRLRAVATGVVDASGGGLGLGGRVAVDVAELEQAAGTILAGGSSEWTAARLAAELLPEWDDDWVILERERLRELSLHAIEMLSRQLSGAGRHAEAVAAAFAAVRLDPLRESAARTLIQAQLAEGNRAQAVRTFLEFRGRLDAELGIEPSEALLGLMQALRFGLD
ncbi:MAG: BTAD domain-containing putative transcriptional regulator [Dehalococcoidia bacterium]